ncbi:MAG: Transposase IS200 like protein [Bacteroidetes bacterium ADurb.Bin028]|nr:MAG: Transposase IS200 like protein [Bacteroidetes bacterium ADurb.Bin028]
MKDNDFKSNRHSIYNLKYHLVIITKYRHKCINKEILNDLNEIFKKIIEGKNGTLIEFNGEIDHVHLLFETPPQVELAKLVNTLKTVSSRLIRKKHSEYLKKYYWKPVFWSRSYCILTTGGATIEVIEKYIKSQAGIKD